MSTDDALRPTKLDRAPRPIHTSAPDEVTPKVPPAPPASVASSVKSRRSFMIDDELYLRMRAALINTRNYPDEAVTLTDFVHVALEQYIESLETEYHEGKPWPLSEGQRPLPPGRAVI